MSGNNVKKDYIIIKIDSTWKIEKRRREEEEEEEEEEGEV
jgi:hypothetical protein